MRLVASSVTLLFLLGCQHPDYVTRAELRELLAPPPLDANLALTPERSAVFARLAAEAFVAPPATFPATDAMAATDRYTDRLAKAISAVNECLDICAENISNVETTAYKSVRVVRSPDGKNKFSSDMEQGSLQNTNRPLDLGISGGGFFQVQTPDERILYTRSGNFFVTNEGMIVLGMGDGYRLEPPIAVPPGVTEISVSENGAVTVLVSGQEVKQNIGQISLMVFMNPAALERRGGGMFVETKASGEPTRCDPGQDGAGTFLQGFLEASNVDPAKEYLRIRFLQNWRATMLRTIDAR